MSQKQSIHPRLRDIHRCLNIGWALLGLCVLLLIALGGFLYRLNMQSDAVSATQVGLGIALALTGMGLFNAARYQQAKLTALLQIGLKHTESK